MWMVFKKEMLELLRDRKTLFFMIALPIIIFPALAGVVGYFSSKAIQQAESKTLYYHIVGEQYAPELVQALETSAYFSRSEKVTSDNFHAEIRAGNVDFVLEIPDNYSNNILESGQITLKMYLNDAGLNLVETRLKSIVDKHTARLRETAFAAVNLSDAQQQAVLQPIVLTKVDVADKRENWGEKIGGLIPYLIFILCLQGAMYPAADIGAGEKERGTLETLLISPIERHKLVMGKFFTIATAGVMAALTTISSIALWGTVLSQGLAIAFVSEFMASIGAIDFFLMFLMLVPVVAIFAAVLLSLSIYARSYKEAQSYSGALVFVVIFPIILAMLPGVELKGVWAWVPLTNVSLAIKELIKGTMDYYQLVGILASTALIAGGLIVFCVRWFNRETVLFR
ncbi:ABC transporter permease [Aestuariibacter sp. AA17]|uniref:ABC transporter permease n=1 Tax=Fluctibacter corallii TaxID=2984329 RepID=A0ABT3ABD5_9ALTE|nr:ABC transporter permease [Aestuariibacter sp. AA17]MCV2885607.1 ABC transporter permease [Aestuariibacter sp. AA17]